MRMRILGLTFAAALCCGAAGAALAQSRPALQPTRDVTVTYRITGEAPAGPPGGGAGPREMRVFYAAASHRMRIENQRRGAISYAIVDRPHHSMVVVLPAQHRFMTLPMRGTRNPVLMEDDPNLAFTRDGSQTIAGLTCTEWKVADRTDPAHHGTACLTADGVLLHGADATGARGILATKVEYGALAPDLFAPPAGFQKMEMPPRPSR